MKHESVISRIISAIKGNKVAIRENLFYDAIKGTTDFADDDLPNWRSVKAIISSGGGVPVTITAGVTGTPLTIAYTLSATPSYALKRTSDNSYDWNTGVTYDGAHFTINGANDGTGHFADSYVFCIKP